VYLTSEAYGKVKSESFRDVKNPQKYIMM